MLQGRPHHLFARVLSAATLFLLIAGGLVTSTGSGLSVPDWPLSYGMFFPPMIGGIRFEHSHRVIAGTVGVLTVVLCLLFLRYEPRAWVKRLSIVAVLAVIAQAVLGAITVIYLLPMPVSVAHATLGQLFFCLIAFLTLVTSDDWQRSVPARSPYAGSFARLSLTTALFVFAQLIAGATVRHSGKGLELHFFIAFFIVVHAVFLNLKALRDPVMAQKMLFQIALMDCLLIAQLFLGLGSFYFVFILDKAEMPRFWEVIMTTAHQTTGAVIFANSVLMAARAFRLFKQGDSEAYPSDYLDLMKPRVTLAALATTGVGYFLASPNTNLSTRLLHALLGAFLIGGGANAMNQYLERDTDRLMKRTEKRPIPGGRLSAPDVFWFGLPTALVGIAELFVFVNPLTGCLGALTFISYVYWYTPLKRRTTFNTFVGALPGALPIAMGWTAASGQWGMEPLTLFLILFLWQLPHFFAIAWVYRDDYRRSGLRMLPAEDPDGRQTGIRIVLYTLLLIPATLLPVSIGLSGPTYFLSAILSDIVLLGLAVWLFQSRLAHAKKFVGASIYYLFILLIALVADKIR